ncbi:hypothetical protein [Paenibacillus sp. 23TSA30-6]|uniref:hypothetical protein n=1 Tax=Paenibacillus sp. 23TSA30-6 TaxID=2546104 RepID=UPI00178783FC|nr:hypothetical protein [Paenibacillus sp. 23TSA30-6]MBE0335099.1 hypothetical protein [Paenibacillus sp. 23TSA30-6]
MYQNIYQPNYNYGNSQQNLRQSRRVELDEGLLASSSDLGNGFYSFSWNQEIDANETVIYFLSVRGLKVINGGWAPGGYQSLYALESYPRGMNQWVITVVNSNQRRSLQLFLIAKN